MASIDLIHFAGLTRRTATPATAAPPARPRAAPPPAPKPAPVSAAESKASREGARMERKRWKAVVYSSAFATNPAVAAHLLAGTSKPPSEIISLLRTIAADDKATHRASPAGIAERWAAAAKRAGLGPLSTQ